MFCFYFFKQKHIKYLFSVLAGLFTIAGFYQMTVWALGKHKNYKKEFSDYPKNRKSIVPFIIWISNSLFCYRTFLLISLLWAFNFWSSLVHHEILFYAYLILITRNINDCMHHKIRFLKKIVINTKYFMFFICIFLMPCINKGCLSYE